MTISKTYKRLNTFLLLIYLLVLYLGYTLMIPGLLRSYTWKGFYVVYSFLLSSFFYIQSYNRIPHKLKSYLVVALLLLLLHLLFSKSAYYNIVHIYSIVFFLVVLPYTDINGNRLSFVLILSFFVLTLIQLPDIIYCSFSSDESNKGYASFFQGANGVGPYTYAIMLCVVYKYYHQSKERHTKTMYILSFLYLLFVINSTHNRSIILSLVLWGVGIYVLEKVKMNNKLFFWTYMLGIIILGSVMVYFEAIIGDDALFSLEMYGKGASSRGRAEQIFLAFSKYNLSLFGEGYGVVTGYVSDLTEYTIHNMFVATMFDYGILIMCLYIYFIYLVYCYLNTAILKSFLLSIQVHFFFEPFVAYDSKFMMIVLYVALLQNAYNNNYPKIKKYKI